MRCPVCNNEMEEGGIITTGVAAWHPMEEFEKTGLKRLLYKRGHCIGRFNLVLGQSRIPGAFFCRHCNTVTGVFDVTYDEMRMNKENEDHQPEESDNGIE